MIGKERTGESNKGKMEMNMRFSQRVPVLASIKLNLFSLG